jgi:quinoprotein glucose dehydrogenase
MFHARPFTLLSLVGIAAVLTVVSSSAVAVPTGVTPAPEAPVVSPASDAPQKAAAGFGMPEGFVVELFAAEPDVANPVAFTIDERGRVFVCESFRQNQGVTDNRGHDAVWVDADLASRSVEDRRQYHLRLLGDKAPDYEKQDDRVRLLVDSDGDGKADSATVYADRFNSLVDGTLAGALARRGDLFLTCIPSLYRLRDTDGDGRADASPDERAVLSTGYGARVAFRGHDLHGLVLGHDGRLYFSIGDRGYAIEHDGRIDADPGTGAVFRCEPDGSQLEVFAHGLRNPQELAFDDYGNLFTIDNNSDAGDKARLIHIVPGAEIGWNMAYQYLPDRGPWHREKIWHLEHDGQPAWIVPPLAHITSGPSGFTAYPGTGLTPHFDGRFLIADFRGAAAGSSVTTFRLRPRGATFEPDDVEPTFKDILATDVEIGPDAAVWISDWVEGWNGPGKGRLWRFRPKDPDAKAVTEVRTLLAGDWQALPAERLGELLGHADRRLRLEAQWELARRSDAPRLAATATDSSRPLLARVHGIQGLGQIARQGGHASNDAPAEAVAGLLRACNDSAWEARLVAARALGEIAADAPERSAIRMALLAALSDDHPHLRVAAAIAVGRLGHRPHDAPAVVDRLVDMARSDAMKDPTLRHAIVMGLAGAVPAERLGALVADDRANVRLAACLAMRRLADARISAFLADADERVALEAARAIHDLPIPEALPTLAARAADGPVAEPFLRRAISAAERVGTPAAAETLVRVVRRADASGEVRIMALDALRDWDSPPPKNRVTNAWQPHALPRDRAVARAALEPSLGDLLSQSPASGAALKLDEATRSALLTTASALGIKDVGPLLAAWSLDAGCSPASRARAVDSLLAADDRGVVDLAARLLEDPQPLVRTAARRVRVAKLPPTDVVPELATATTAADMAERQAAVRLLGGIDHPAARDAVTALVARLEAGQLDPALELETNEAAAARLGQQRADVLAAARATGPDPLGIWRDVTAGGDVAAGREVFFGKTEVSCVRCHKAEQKGGDVGPQLDGIAAKRDARHLLESIVHPDAKVEDAFRTTVIATDDGRTVAGIVVGEDAQELKLKNAEGKVVAVPIASIDERTSGPSAMPADLAGKLSRRELRDLLAWLHSLK